MFKGQKRDRILMGMDFKQYEKHAIFFHEENGALILLEMKHV